MLKARLFAFVRGRLADRRERLGLPEPEREPLAPAEALTLGFARRFATYKRADILFHDLDRLDRLVERPASGRCRSSSPARPTRATRAARRWRSGWRTWRRTRASPAGSCSSRTTTMHVGRQLVQGVDVWLNTPRRPLEACGTSGQKCILNGVLNCSILDGWWAEGYDGGNGFAIGARRDPRQPRDPGRARRPGRSSRCWRREVVPLYYDARRRRASPTAGSRRVKRAIRTLAWRYNADRMVMDYVEECYLPAAGGETCRSGDGRGRDAPNPFFCNNSAAFSWQKPFDPRSCCQPDVPILKREVDLSPSHLFELSRVEHPWWVAYVRSRQEKGLARYLSHLAGQGVGFYLPQAEKRVRRAGRTFVSSLPLFPGYLFFRGGAEARREALRSNLIVEVLPVLDQARPGGGAARACGGSSRRARRSSPIPIWRSGTRWRSWTVRSRGGRARCCGRRDGCGWWSR